MRGLACLVMGLVSLSAASSAKEHSCPTTGEKPGMYSRLGTILCFQDVDAERRHLEIPSPDGAVLLLVDGTTETVVKGGRQLGPSFDIGTEETDVIWSPDSRAVITTLSLGGLGPVSAGVSYIPDGLRPEVPSITKLIQKDFALRHPDRPCNENVNVAGLTWEGSHKAVFAAEVPSSSSCGKMIGYFEGYVVSIPEGKILARFSHKQTVKRWRSILAPQMLDDR
jgi:hypothetical protein